MSQGTPNSSIPKSVPSAVSFSANNSVPVLTAPIKGPYKPQTGKSINPVVPRTEVEGEIPVQPHFRALGQTAPTNYAGSLGAPSVPTDGFLFRRQPIDQHYMSEVESRNPYGKVNAPGTVGWWTRVQSFANHIAYNQNTTNTGFKVNGPQQRTSVMLNALPPNGQFGVNTFVPRQQPQAVAYNRIDPRRIGTDKYGSGVLNTDTYGAGQTAGGIGGNNYTPTPGSPDTNAITNPPDASGMPTWG